MRAGAGLGRVVVGNSDSPAGLRALREAVAAARPRGQRLQAVRAYPVPRTSPGYYASAAGLPLVPAALGSDVAPERDRSLQARAGAVVPAARCGGRRGGGKWVGPVDQQLGEPARDSARRRAE